MPRDTFKRAVGRMLRGRMGTTATLTNYTDDGTTDEHGDPTRQQDNQSTGVAAIFRQPQRVTDVERQEGLGLDGSEDVIVWVDDDEDVREAGNGTRYPTRITHGTTGREYDVVNKWDNDAGQIVLSAKEV